MSHYFISQFDVSNRWLRQTPTLILLCSLLIIIWLCLPSSALACGTITGPGDWFDENIAQAEQTINDCINPFGASTESSPFILKIDGSAITANSRLKLKATSTIDWEILQTGQDFGGRHAFYRREGNNYQFVPVIPRSITQSDYIESAEEFFDDEAEEASLHLAYLENDDSVVEDPLWDYERHYAFLEYAESNFSPVTVSLVPGDYTLVSKQEFLYQTYHSTPPKNNFWAWLIPTAHANFDPKNQLFTFDFTLESPAVLLTPPAILFIPGLMGTRLYETSTGCDGEEAEEHERWYSRSDCDQLRLQTNYLGQSQNTIYTYASGESLLDQVSAYYISPNIYKSFLHDLETWRAAGLISAFDVLPYDWRLRLDDLLAITRNPETQRLQVNSSTPLNQTYLYETLSRLAQTAPAGKVTVVAHSNGGLLIKYFLSELAEQNDPLLARIENLILVAVPQLGTPEAVVGTLHGVPLDHVMSQEVARTLLSQLPAAQHLWPHSAYFERVRTPVVTFAPGTEINWPELFGPTITSVGELRRFMTEESGRVAPDASDLLTPQVVNSYGFGYQKSVATSLNAWQPPTTITLYQVAGVGLPTPANLQYFNDYKCIKRSFSTCTGYTRTLGYRVGMVLDGDDVVLTPSALALVEGERWWLNMRLYNNSNIDRLHRDILEISDLRDFVLRVAQATTTPAYDYLSTTAPALSGARLVFQLHSPLDMFVTLSDGEVVGSSSPARQGVRYQRYGETQVLAVPEDEENFTVQLLGLAEGSFTLDIEQYQADHLQERQTFSAVPVVPGSRVALTFPTVSYASSLATLPLDYDGDGVVDTAVVAGPPPLLVSEATPLPTSSTPHRRGSRQSVETLALAPEAPLLGQVNLTHAEYEHLRQQVTLLEQAVALLTILIERKQ